MHNCFLSWLLFVKVVVCFPANVQRHGSKAEVSNVVVQQPDHAVLRKESDITMEVSANGQTIKYSSLKSGEAQCSLNMQQQMARLNLGVNEKNGNIEAGLERLPFFAKWTSATMKGCGWSKTLWNDRKHDHILVAQNLEGNNNGIKAKSCAISFAGSNDDDDWANTNARKHTDWVEYSKDKAAWTRNKSVLLGKWGEYDAYEGVVEEYTNITLNNAAWDQWMTLLASGNCNYIYVTGDSLGGALAQLHVLDLTKQSKCGNHNCFLVPFSPDPIFFGKSIPQTECNQSWLIYAKYDPVVQGDPVPVGSNQASFQEMYGQWIDVTTVNSVVGAHRRMLYGDFMGVHVADYGSHSCSKVTYGREYFPVTGKDEAYKKGVNIELLLGMMPWHMPFYMLYMLDAHELKLPDFFFNWKAHVFFLESIFSHGTATAAGPKIETLETPQFYAAQTHSSSTLLTCLKAVNAEWQQLKQDWVEMAPPDHVTLLIAEHFTACLP